VRIVSSYFSLGYILKFLQCCLPQQLLINNPESEGKMWVLSSVFEDKGDLHLDAILGDLSILIDDDVTKIMKESKLVIVFSQYFYIILM